MNTSDHWVPTDVGTLFARAWMPPDIRPDDTPAILLFHDSLGCVELWRDFPEQLATATRRIVVAYDRLGFGKSDARSGQLPPTFITDEPAVVMQLRAALGDVSGAGPMVLFGHSVGGAMAAATAARTPADCAALVTESAQSFVEDRTLDGIRAAREGFEQPGQLDRLARYHGAKARWVLHAWIDTWLDPAFAQWRLDDELHRVHCPTLALHGDDDEYGSTEHPQRIARLVQGPSRAVILERCGHVPHREQPERVLDEVSTLLSTV
jgi:pimeloyl-ACP methyl ester carboxylesterase